MYITLVALFTLSTYTILMLVNNTNPNDIIRQYESAIICIAIASCAFVVTLGAAAAHLYDQVPSCAHA